MLRKNGTDESVMDPPETSNFDTGFVVPKPTDPETYAPPVTWSGCDAVPVGVADPMSTELVVLIPEAPVVHWDPLAVELIVTCPVDPETVTFVPATIEVTIPVKLMPDPVDAKSPTVDKPTLEST